MFCSSLQHFSLKKRLILLANKNLAELRLNKCLVWWFFQWSRFAKINSHNLQKFLPHRLVRLAFIVPTFLSPPPMTLSSSPMSGKGRVLAKRAKQQALLTNEVKAEWEKFLFLAFRHPSTKREWSVLGRNRVEMQLISPCVFDHLVSDFEKNRSSVG